MAIGRSSMHKTAWEIAASACLGENQEAFVVVVVVGGCGVRTWSRNKALIGGKTLPYVITHILADKSIII